jgi:hypothetical protein
MKIVIKRLDLGIGEIIARHSYDTAVDFLIKITKRQFVDRFSGKDFFSPLVTVTGDQFPLTRSLRGTNGILHLAGYGTAPLHTLL